MRADKFSELRRRISAGSVNFFIHAEAMNDRIRGYPVNHHEDRTNEVGDYPNHLTRSVNSWHLNYNNYQNWKNTTKEIRFKVVYIGHGKIGQDHRGDCNAQFTEKHEETSDTVDGTESCCVSKDKEESFLCTWTKAFSCHGNLKEYKLSKGFSDSNYLNISMPTEESNESFEALDAAVHALEGNIDDLPLSIFLSELF